MTMSLTNNGYIIKSLDERPYIDVDRDYFGIGRYITWPLNNINDVESKRLSTEAIERWFGYNGCVMWAVPNFNYLERYILHCKNIGLSFYCLQIESMCPNCKAEFDLPIERVLGYDYSSCNLEESCLHDDLGSVDKSIQDDFTSIRARLNQFGLADSPEIIFDYLSTRSRLFDSEFKLEEEYYYPSIVKISQVSITTFRKRCIT